MRDQHQKKDEGRARMELLDPLALESLAGVLEYGAEKYSPHGWRQGVEWSRLLAATMRHTLAYLKGEDVDSETGINHMAHVMCNAMFLVNYAETHRELDDRHKDVVDTTPKISYPPDHEFIGYGQIPVMKSMSVKCMVVDECTTPERNHPHTFVEDGGKSGVCPTCGYLKDDWRHDVESVRS